MSVLTMNYSPRDRRRRRIRKALAGTPARPRLAVFRSLNHIYAQLIDDTSGTTLAAASSRELGADIKLPEGITNRKIGLAYRVGETLASKAAQKKISAVVFDRGGYRYHGRVKALADGARAGKLEF